MLKRISFIVFGILLIGLVFFSSKTARAANGTIDKLAIGSQTEIYDDGNTHFVPDHRLWIDSTDSTVFGAGGFSLNYNPVNHTFGTTVTDDGNTHIAADHRLWLDTTDSTVVGSGGLSFAYTGSGFNSSMYDNNQLHIATDDYLYLDAPVTTFIQNNLNVGGTVTGASGNISMWTNDAGYITGLGAGVLLADGTIDLTNNWTISTNNITLTNGTLQAKTLTDGTATFTNGILTGSLNVTTQGNNFNNANQLVQLDASGFLPALNASALTNLSKSQIGLGSVENTALSTWNGSLNLNTLGTITTGTWNGATISIANGGTGQTTKTNAFDALSPTSATGDMIYFNGADNVALQGGTEGDILFFSGGVPTWNSNTAAISAMTAATSASTILNGDFAQVWDWSVTTANRAAFTFGENVASTATGSPVILQASTLASSTATPLYVKNLGAANSFRVDDQSSDTTPFIIDNAGNVAIGSDFFDPVNPEKLKVDAGITTSSNIITGYGNLNAPLFLQIQNRNSGVSASSDIEATADNGDSTTYYTHVGMKSSGYNNPLRSITGANDGFLYVMGGVGVGGNLAIGTASANTVIKFHTGGTTAADEQMRIDGNGNVGINTTAPGSALDVKGVIRLSGATSGYIGLQGAADAGSTTYTLPSVDGLVGDVLTTNGTGGLTWTDRYGKFQRVGTLISPNVAGDNVTTSGDFYTTGTGDIYTAGSGTITSAGLLTGNLGLTISGALASLNDNSNFNTTINTGTSAGTVTIGSGNSGAINVISGSALTLTGGAASTWGTTVGTLTLQAASAAITDYIQIGVGGAGSASPDLLALDVKSTTGDPATGTDGAMYYNEFTNKFRCHVNGSWSNCDTTGGTVDLQSAYNDGASIVTSVNVPIAFTLTAGDFNVSGAGAVNLTPTGASQFTSGGALTLTGGASSTWGTSAGNLNLQVAGTGTSANVQIGSGVASATPDRLVLDIGTADPAGSNGAMYYSTGTNSFRCYANGGWQECGQTAASATTLQQAYTAGATITTTGNPLTFALASGNLTVSGAGSANLTPTGASSFTSGAALTLTGGASSIWSTSAGSLTVDSAATLNLGSSNATGITIGQAGVTTTNVGTLQLGNSSTIGVLKISDGSSNFINFTAPAISSDYTLTWPTDTGLSGQALLTDGAGNLSWTNITGNLMTTEGDMLYRDGVGNARLARGTTGQILQSSATTVGWITPTASTVGLGNVTNDAQIAASIGLAKGDLIAYTASDNPVRLPVGGTTGWVLTVDPTQVTGMKWTAAPSAPVTTVFGRTGDILSATNDYTWAQIDKSTSSIADITTRSAGDLNSGTLSDARLSVNVTKQGNTFNGASELVQLNASSLLPAVDGSQLINLNKTQVGLGNVENTALSTWAGSTNLTTLGTISTGSWNASAIAANHGGTGQTTYAIGDILFASGTSTLSKLSVGTNGQVLTLSSGLPAWNNSAVISVFGRTGVVAAASTDYTTLTALTNLSGAGALTVTAGSASTWSTTTGNLTLQAGSGTVSLGTSTILTANGALSISSGAGTALSVDSGTTGALNLGTGAFAKTITIGSSSSSAIKIGNLSTQFGVVYTSAADGTLAQTSAGTSGQVLKSNGASAPTWTDGGTMMLSGNSSNTAVNNTTLFFPITGGVTGNAADTQAGTRTLVSRAGTVKNLYVKLSAALGAGKTGTVTVYKNGVATTLLTTLSVGPTSFNDITNSFTVVAGDEIGIQVATTGNVKFSWAADLTY